MLWHAFQIEGMSLGYETMRARPGPALWAASDGARLPVVCDAASCTEGLREAVTTGPDQFRALRVVDALTYTRAELLPRLRAVAAFGSLGLHPTCSTTRLGINDDLSAVAAFVADEVVVPDDWGCCGFGGDRGLLHPELLAAATAREAAAIGLRAPEVCASANRTCEIGMQPTTGRDFVHVLELVEIATRPDRATNDTLENT